MSRVSHAIDRVGVSFDDPNLVANAGLLLVGTLVVRLGLERLVNATVRLGGRVGGARPGRKVLTLVHAMVAGGSPHRPRRHAALGRHAAGAAHPGDGALDAGHVPAGVHLRSCPPARSRRRRGAAAGVGAGRRARARPLVIDVDSTICEVAGKAKQGAAFGYTKVLGYHPILATRADTGEVLHARMRKGSANTARGARRFIDELVARVRRAGASGEIVHALRLGVLVQRHDRHPRPPRRALHDGRAHQHQRHRRRHRRHRPRTPGSTSTTPPTGRPRWPSAPTRAARLIVRRTRLTGAAQRRLWPDWRHHAFLTDLDGDAVDVDAFHRRPRRRRARHPRPQGGRRARARAVGQLPRQQRLAAMRGAGPQPDPLDRHPRPARPRSTS